MTQTSHEFLSALYPEPFHHFMRDAGLDRDAGAPELVLWTRPKIGKTSRSYWLSSVDAAARQAEALRADHNVFFGVALQDRASALAAARETRPKATESTVRGRQDTALTLPALWVDLDVAGPGHSSGTLPPNRDAALGLLAAVPRPPSAIVWSGGGFHVYWLMQEVRILDNDQARDAARSLLRRVQWAVQREAGARGWSVDHTAELARVLRLPGTLNHKTGAPRETVIEHLDPGVRYHGADFDLLAEPPARQTLVRQTSARQTLVRQTLVRQTSAGNGSSADCANFDSAALDSAALDSSAVDSAILDSAALDSGPPSDFGPVFDGCGWLRACHENSWTLSEIHWFAALTILVRCMLMLGSGVILDGRALGHRMSRNYPRYDAAETDRKLDHALGPRSRPFTCQKIADDLGAWQEHCQHCQHRGHIKSPIVLGRRRGSLVNGLGGDGAGGDSAGGDSNNGGAGREPIPVSHLENEVADQALAAVADRELNLFRRGGALVQVVQWRDGAPASEVPSEVPAASAAPASEVPAASADASADEVPATSAAASDDATHPIHRSLEAPAARQVLDARMRELLATHCEFQLAKRTKNGIHWRPVHPPAWVSKAILGRFDWPRLPRLEGVVEGPVLRSDGSVLQTPGYDPTSGLYLAPQIDFEAVPEMPTADQCEEALLSITEAVCDFPFASEAHFAGWLAALLTPLARFAFVGPSPVNLVDANVRGAGKSLLADVCHLIVTGRPAPRMPYARDESELRKEITSIALKARQLVVIDNVTGAFGSPTLDLACTATSWADRLLGQNVDLELPLAITWYVTGNNIELTGDMPRRCLHIRLESPEEKPEHRGGFRHPRLSEWLIAERPRLLPAALTLLTGYHHAGRPDQQLKPWGSFEGWSDLVRNTVAWLGLPDPASINQDVAATVNPRGAAEARLLAGLEEVLPSLGGAATVRQILRTLEDNALQYETLRSALEDLVPRLRAGELPTPVKLGSILRSIRGRRLDGRCLHTGEKTRQGIAWSVTV